MSGGVNWRGTWSFNTRYEVNDAVFNSEDEKTYICTKSSINYPPQYFNSGFQLMAGLDISQIDGGEF
jgi:hypothetical protein